MTRRRDRDNFLLQGSLNERARWIRKVRFIAGLFMFVFFGYLRILNWLEFPFFVFALAPMFEMFVNQPYEWVLKRVKSTNALIFVNQVLDVLAVTWGIYFVGGTDMLPMVLVYPLIFIFTAIALTPAKTFFMANLSFLSYAAIVFAEKYAIIPQISRLHQAGCCGSGRVDMILLVGVMYNLIAYYAVYLTKALRRREETLNERVKELGFFYDLSRITETYGDLDEKFMRGVVELLPSAYKYPRWICARIEFLGREYKTGNFRETEWWQAESIKVRGAELGVIEVYYLKKLPVEDEGPFISQERMLIEILAERLGRIAERKSARKELEEYSLELQRSNNDLNDFAYIISHDLKEPLRNIEAFADLTAQDCESHLDVQGRRNIQRIKANAHRMSALIGNLLELSRLERKKNLLEETDVKGIVREAVSRCEYSIKNSAAEISVAGEMPVLVCDRVRITEVFANLISNAVKFRRDEPLRVEIGCVKKGPFYEFYVKDNGQGMEKNDLEKIFTMFTRLGTEKDERGSGIGLNIVRRIIKTHGGSIRVESEPGKGTTFYFTLPENPQKKEGKV
jgi:signal transduction histidine kinase